MIELKFHHFLKWDEINELVEKAKNTMVIVKLPNSIFNSPKMEYKINFMKQNHIIVEKDTEKRGRNKKIDDELKEKILELYKEGYTINQIAKMMKLPKSTLFTNVKQEINEIKTNSKKEELQTLTYQYKEYLIKNDLYNSYIETQFMELKVYVDNDEIETAYNKLKEILQYIKEKQKINKKNDKTRYTRKR